MIQAKPVAAYILNRRVYKESSLILDIYTADHGRLSLIANGALKSKKGWSAILQVFQPLLLSWSGKSSLKTLISADAPSMAITLNGQRLFSAYYLNELLLKLLPQNDISSNSNDLLLFSVYSETLQSLTEHEHIEIPLRKFEYQLLSELGVFPDSKMDIQGNIIEFDHLYSYIPQQGFNLCHRKEFDSPQSNQIYIKGEYLAQLSEDSFSDGVDKLFLSQFKRLMRVLINELLGGQELKSRALFKSYQPYTG